MARIKVIITTRRAWTLLVVLALLAFVVQSVAFSGASFTAATTNQASFTAGTVRLTNDHDGQVIINSTYLRPGESSPVVTVNLTNAGTLTGPLTLSVGSVTDTPGQSRFLHRSPSRGGRQRQRHDALQRSHQRSRHAHARYAQSRTGACLSPQPALRRSRCESELCRVTRPPSDCSSLCRHDAQASHSPVRDRHRGLAGDRGRGRRHAVDTRLPALRHHRRIHDRDDPQRLSDLQQERAGEDAQGGRHHHVLPSELAYGRSLTESSRPRAMRRTTASSRPRAISTRRPTRGSSPSIARSRPSTTSTSRTSGMCWWRSLCPSRASSSWRCRRW